MRTELGVTMGTETTFILSHDVPNLSCISLISVPAVDPWAEHHQDDFLLLCCLLPRMHNFIHVCPHKGTRHIQSNGVTAVPCINHCSQENCLFSDCGGCGFLYGDMHSLFSPIGTSTTFGLAASFAFKEHQLSQQFPALFWSEFPLAHRSNDSSCYISFFTAISLPSTKSLSLFFIDNWGVSMGTSSLIARTMSLFRPSRSNVIKSY